MITKLSWDSDFFGYPVGEMALKPNDRFDLKRFLQVKKEYKLVYITTQKPLDLKGVDFHHADTKVLYIKHLPAIQVPLPKPCLPIDNPDAHKPQLMELVLESGRYSRFKTDPRFINREYDKIYHTWMEAAIDGTFGKAILVCRTEQAINGFVLVIETDEMTASMWLMAVDPAKRGLGIGKALLASAEAFAIEKGYTEMQVITQLANTEARTLFERSGYRLAELSYTYHYWNV